jgi:hypothetical protein
MEDKRRGLYSEIKELMRHLYATGSLTKDDVRDYELVVLCDYDGPVQRYWDEQPNV